MIFPSFSSTTDNCQSEYANTKISVVISAIVNLNCLHAGNSGPFDYISVTPPYTQVDYGVLMRQISESSLIGENTFIVCTSFLLSYCSWS